MKNHIFGTFFVAGLVLLSGCSTLVSPPAQAHLAKAGERPTLMLGAADSATAATCRTRDVVTVGDGTLGTKVQLKLACRESTQPTWTVQVIATCTDIPEAGVDCLEKGSWTLKWSGRAEIDREPQDLGTSRHTAEAFQKFLESLEPPPPPNKNKDDAPIGEPTKHGGK